MARQHEEEEVYDIYVDVETGELHRFYSRDLKPLAKEDWMERIGSASNKEQEERAIREYEEAHPDIKIIREKPEDERGKGGYEGA